MVPFISSMVQCSIMLMIELMVMIVGTKKLHMTVDDALNNDALQGKITKYIANNSKRLWSRFKIPVLVLANGFQYQYPPLISAISARMLADIRSAISNISGFWYISLVSGFEVPDTILTSWNQPISVLILMIPSILLILRAGFADIDTKNHWLISIPILKF